MGRLFMNGHNFRRIKVNVFMKRTFLVFGTLLITAAAVFAQGEMNSKGEPVVKSKESAPVELKSGEKITRGAALVKGTKKVSLEKVFKDPAKFADRTVAVDGVIVRSCKKEGCWMEMAEKAGGKSVRVTFGDHAFFIPLNAAGMKVKAQGVFKTKTLSKEHVDHQI